MNPITVSFAEAQSRPTIQASSEFYPLTLSASWHSNLASSCVLQIPAGQVRQQAYPENDRHRLSTAEKYSRPKRARSISSQTRVQVAPRSTTPGFRTPQSMMSTRDRTILDAQFLAMNVSNVDVPLTNNDFMFKRLETIGSGSYATVYKTQNRVNGQVFALKEIKLQPQEGLPFTAIREVSLLRGLRHANIVRLYQIVHQPHALVLIFEYMVSTFYNNFYFVFFRKRIYPSTWRTIKMVWNVFRPKCSCSSFFEVLLIVMRERFCIGKSFLYT